MIKKGLIILLFPIFGFSQETPPLPVTGGAVSYECNGILFSGKISVSHCEKKHMSCYNLYFDASCDDKVVSKNISVSMNEKQLQNSISIEKDLMATRSIYLGMISSIISSQRKNIEKKKLKALYKNKEQIILMMKMLNETEKEQLNKIIEKYK